MAKIKFIFRHKWHTFWQKIYLYRSLILLFLLFFVSIVTPCLIAKISNANSLVQNQDYGIQLVQKSKKQYEASNFAKAAEFLEQAENTFIEQEDDLNRAMVLSNLSLVYQKLGRFNDGEDAIDKSLKLLNNISASEEQVRIKAQSLDIKGQLQRERNQSKKALHTWKQANKLYSQLNNQEAIAHNQFKQILAMEDLGLYFNACNALIKELNVDIKIRGSDIYVKDCEPFKLNKNKPDEKNYKIFKPSDRQIDIQISSAQPDSLLKVQELQKLGEILRVEQNLPQYRHLLKEAILTEALDLATKLEPSAKVNDRIASIYLSLGNIASANEKFFTSRYCKTALECYRKAEIIETSKKLKIQARLNQLSLLIKDYKPSSETSDLANKIQSSLRKLLEKLPPSRFSVNSHINLAQNLLCSYTIKTSLDKNITEQSSSILQQCQFPEQETKQSSEATNLPEIAQIVRKAIIQSQAIGNRQSEAFAHGFMGSIYQQIALESLDQKQENIKIALMETSEALKLISSTREPQIAYLWHWQLGRLRKAQSALAQTPEDKEVFLEKAKTAYKEAYLIVNSLRVDLLDTKREIQFDFRDRFEPIYREYVSLQLPFNKENGEPAQFKPLVEAEELTDDTKDVNIRKVIADLQLAELENFLDCNISDNDRKSVDIDEVIDSEKKTAAIYPIILDSRIEVLLKLPQSKQLYRRSPSVLISRKEVKEKLQQLRKELEQPYFSSKRGKPVAQEVYNWLIEPAEKQGLLEQEQTLVFVLDGAFRNIPMAALYDGEKYLVENYAIAVALGNLELPRSKPKRQFKALIAGLSEKPQCKNPECKQFGLLKYVEQEVNGINDVLQKRDVEVKRLDDDQFTSKALENEIKTAPYNIVHLATHGEFGFSRDSTFILTAPPESEDKLLRKKDNLKTPFSDQEKKSNTNSEGKITSTNATLYDFEDIKADLNELYNLLQVRRQEPIELLVLSACETGEGDDREVLGIAGMAVQSGTRSTLASLWSIDDSSTAELMKQFYQELTKNEVTKAEALRQAQLHLLENPAAYKPSHWAPYVLVGDWR